VNKGGRRGRRIKRIEKWGKGSHVESSSARRGGCQISDERVCRKVLERETGLRENYQSEGENGAGGGNECYVKGVRRTYALDLFTASYGKDQR